MQPDNKRAGGCLLVVAIFVGLAGGLVTGNAVAGVWVGLAAGIIAAVAVWLLDRRNGT